MGDAIAKSNETVAAVAAGGYNRGDNKRMSPVPVQWKVALLAAIAVVFGALVLVCFAVSSSAITEVSSLKSEVSSLQKALDSNETEANISLTMPEDELHKILRDLPPGLYAFFPAPSCAALPPSPPSGHYWVRASNGSLYCDMTRSCGNIT